MKITKHASQRFEERTDIDKSNQKQFFRGALTHGKSASQISNEVLRKYLLQLESTGSKVKLYKGYIFIHSKNKKTLYTMYKVPEEILEKVT